MVQFRSEQLWKCSGGSRILKGGVLLSRTFSTALVRAHEAGDACTQNDKKGGVPWNPRNPQDPSLKWYIEFGSEQIQIIKKNLL